MLLSHRTVILITAWNPPRDDDKRVLEVQL